MHVPHQPQAIQYNSFESFPILSAIFLTVDIFLKKGTFLKEINSVKNCQK